MHSTYLVSMCRTMVVTSEQVLLSRGTRAAVALACSRTDRAGGARLGTELRAALPGSEEELGMRTMPADKLVGRKYHWTFIFLSILLFCSNSVGVRGM